MASTQSSIDTALTDEVSAARNTAYRRALYIAAALNLMMFGIEFSTALLIGSVALLADAIDFIEDAASYWLTVFVINKSRRIRAIAGFLKGIAMAMVGVVVLWQIIQSFVGLGTPDAFTLGSVGLLALIVNVYCAWLLIRMRHGDSNIRSIWLSSRNDAIANLAIILSAFLVFLLDSHWPDVITGIGIALLNFTAAYEVLTMAYKEFFEPAPI